MTMLVFFWRHVYLFVDVNVSEEYIFSIFRAKLAMLVRRGMNIWLEEEKDGGVAPIRDVSD